ncbi:MAG: RNA 2',3'-cyclic phosphodiesterase [Phycisphaerales bacterium]
MSRPRSNLRLFVAIYPSLEMSAELARSLQQHELPEYRLVPSEQMHLTLHFIGDVPAKQLDTTIESVQRATSGISAFDLTVQRLITLGQRGQARLVAAETDRPPELLEIHRRLVTRLACSVRRNPNDRFRPHLTLCRFKKPTKRIALDSPLDAGPFRVHQVVLMKSTLRSDGAQHHEVASSRLADTDV